MLYLWPQASSMQSMHRRFGVITTAAHRCIPPNIKEGRLWAFDYECFRRPFDYDLWLTHWHRLFPYSKRCLFVVVPDKPFDVHEMLALWCRWHYKLRQQLDLSRLLNISSESQRHFPAGPLSPWPLWQ